jgi:4a-hydroxytetrahydrobiopterin dehydratase
MARVSTALTQDEIAARLKSLNQWRFEDGSIRRIWRTHSWKGTMMAANAVAHLCELAWHHPEMVLNYGSVEVRLNTHDAKGITDKDFALAQKISGLLDWRPQDEGGALDGIPAGDAGAAYIKQQ